MAQAGIFINYRRSDSEGFAGRLEGDLVVRFGADRVFRDIEILPGQDWILEIERAIGASGAFLVLIGPHWLERDAEGRRRLDDPNDVLRGEIEAALRRGLTVVPVVVGGASMPTREGLPGPLRVLARKNAAYLTPQGWPDDVNRLVRALEGVVGPATPPERPIPRRGPRVRTRTGPRAPRSPVPAAIVSVIVLAILGGAGLLIFRAVSNGPGPTPTPTIFPTDFPTFTFAQPKITLEPNSGPRGTVVTVIGSGFPPGGDITIRAEDSAAEATAGRQGSFRAKITISTTPFPTNNVTVVASSSGGSDDALFTLTG